MLTKNKLSLMTTTELKESLKLWKDRRTKTTTESGKQICDWMIMLIKTEFILRDILIESFLLDQAEQAASKGKDN